MDQKYKFFIKDWAVTFRQAADFGENDDAEQSEWIKRLSQLNLTEDADVTWPNLQQFIDRVFESMTLITAAGGYVLHADGRLLMIFRRGHWDLPKGKQEPGEGLEETAIREVEEECGISGLHIASDAFETFHLYNEVGKVVLKRSVWYVMHTSDTSELVAQAEEDILEARWVEIPIPEELRKGSYASIREVIDHFG